MGRFVHFFLCSVVLVLGSCAVFSKRGKTAPDHGVVEGDEAVLAVDPAPVLTSGRYVLQARTPLQREPGAGDLSVVPCHTPVTLTGTSGRYALVELANGDAGWVLATVLRKAESTKIPQRLAKGNSPKFLPAKPLVAADRPEPLNQRTDTRAPVGEEKKSDEVARPPEIPVLQTPDAPTDLPQDILPKMRIDSDLNLE